MPLRALLIMHRDETSEVELPERGKLVLGRARDCDIRLDDRMISRRHAVLHVGEELAVEDLDSANGTVIVSSEGCQTGSTATGAMVERRLEPHHRVPLPDRSLIRVGGLLLAVEEREEQDESCGDIIAVDAATRQVFALADRVAASNISVLLLGESGAGKEVLARRIHQRSRRSAGPFLGLNCGAIAESLLESELFGHEKGAFTGATATKQGLLEAAEGGTVFLDEIGELSPALQVKLLRVLEDLTVLRVGGVKPRPIDVRVIAATNRDLDAEIERGGFREDLYYRLNGITLRVPALRERPDDIEPLARHFLARFGRRGGRRGMPALTAAAREALRSHDWPGNVRELRNAIERALVLSNGGSIEVAHLGLPAGGRQPRRRTTLSERDDPGALAGPEDLRSAVDRMERERILDALNACAGNQTRAAEMLGMTRRALINRLDKYGMPRPRKRAAERAR